MRSMQYDRPCPRWVRLGVVAICGRAGCGTICLVEVRVQLGGIESGIHTLSSSFFEDQLFPRIWISPRPSLSLSISLSLDHNSSLFRKSPCGLSSALALNPPPKPMTVINIANTPKNLNTPLSFLISSPPSSPSPPLPPPCVDPDPGERPPNGYRCKLG
jgi:hypothetical protein